MGRGRVLALLVLAVVALAGPAAADEDEDRSYEIAAVDIEAVLRPDGALAVIESRTFVYDGTYRGGFFSLEPRASQAVELRSLTDDTGVYYVPGQPGAEEPGTYVIDAGDGFEVTWFYGEPATDTTRTFVLDYVVTAAAVRHADVAELYWQWVGDGWEVPTGPVTADVVVPRASEPLVAGDSLLLWAHGPADARIEALESGVVRTTSPGLEPGRFLEARVLLPEDALADAPVLGDPARDDVIAEEQAFADGQERTRRVRSAATGVFAVLGALAVGASGLLHLRAQPPPVPEDLTAAAGSPASSERPALVEHLVNRWSTTRRGLAATVLDLVQRGFLEARPTPQGLELRGVKRPDDRPDRVVYDLLGAASQGAQWVSETQLEAWLTDDTTRAAGRFSAFKKAVSEEAATRGWRTGPRRRYLGFAVAAATVVIGVLAAVVSGGAPWALLLVPVGIALAIVAIRLRPPTGRGRALRDAWRAERDRLRALGTGAELSGDVLPAAVALGLDDSVLAGLRPPSSPESHDRLGHIGYAGYGYGAMYGGLDRALPEAALSPPSSSSGSGGGASSGGGGGGGGSGGGAF